MKKLILTLIMLIGVYAVHGANYLIDSNAKTAGDVITHKGISYVVGTSAFPDFESFINVSPKENSFVYVAPGTYSANITITTPGLTFLGNNAYSDWTITRAAESTITGVIYINASSIVLNGFKFIGDGRIESDYGTNSAPLSNIKILYNYFVESTVKRSTSTPLVELGQVVANSSASSLTSQCRYKNCEVSHNYFAGDATHYPNCIGFGGAFGSTLVEDNYFFDGGTSVYFANAQGTLNIKNNVFKNVGKTTYSAPDGGNNGDFCIGLYRSAFANSTTANIIANEFDNCYGQHSLYPLIRVYQGGEGSTNQVTPVNYSININENTFKNKTTRLPSEHNQGGEKLLLYNDKGTGAGIIFNLADNHYDNRFYKFAWVTLQDGQGIREMYADQFTKFDLSGTNSTFGTSVLTGADVANHATSVALGAVTVIQSFDIDPLTGDMYFIQRMNTSRNTSYNSLYGFASTHDGLTVTRVPCTAISGYNYTYSSTVQSMEIGYGGHGTNMCMVRDKNGQVWLWSGGKATLKDGDDTSTTTARFMFKNGSDINLDGTGNTDSAVEYFNVSGSNDYPACDEISRYLCVRTSGSGVNTYRIYDLDDALDGTKTLLKTVVLNIGDYVNTSISGDEGYNTWSFQSFDIHGDYLYMLEGVSEENSTTITSGDPTLVVTCYNWRSNQYCYRKRINFGRINNLFGEPEGMVIRPDQYGHASLFIAVVNGPSGSRKANVYKYVIDYHTSWDTTTATAVEKGDDTNTAGHFKSDYTAMNYTCDTQSISLSATDITESPSHKVTITNGEYIYGQWYGTISGPDGDAFSVNVASNNPFSTTATATVTFLPKEGRESYNASLRLHSPLASSNVESNDIVIPLTASYILPSTDPLLSTNKLTVSFKAGLGTSITESIAITGQNLTDYISLRLEGDGSDMFSISNELLDIAGGEVTITFSPTAPGTHDATLIAASEGADDVIISLTGVAVEDVLVQNENVTHLDQVWNYSEISGNSANWITNGTQVTQDMALKDGKLYVVHRTANSDNKILIVDAYSGQKLSELNTEACNSGIYYLSAIEVLGDKVIACNLQTSISSPLIIYMWDDDQSEPVKLLETTERPEDAARIGDALSVSGDIANGKIWFSYGSNVFYYAVTNGVCATTPVVIPLTKDGASHNVANGVSSSNVTVEDDGSFWVSSKDNYAVHYNADGSYIEALSDSQLTNVAGTDTKLFTLGAKKYIAATNYLNQTNTSLSEGALRLLDATEGNTSATIVGTYPSAGLGTTRNTSYRNTICGEVTNTNFNLWVLVPLQGAAHYTFQHSTPTGVDQVASDYDVLVSVIDRYIKIAGVEAVAIDLYSLMGIHLLNAQQTNEVDASNLCRGAYIVAITDSKGNVSTHKIIL